MQIKRIQWDFDAWEDYLYWQAQNKKMIKRINDEHRIVYAVEGETLFIFSCKGHYG